MSIKSSDMKPGMRYSKPDESGLENKLVNPKYKYLQLRHIYIMSVFYVPIFTSNVWSSNKACPK